MKTALRNKYFYLGTVIALVAVFLFQNNRPVSIDFFFWTLASANLLVLLAVFFGLGAVTGYFGHQIYRLKKRARQKTRESRRESGRKNKREDAGRGGYSPREGSPVH